MEHNKQYKMSSTKQSNIARQKFPGGKIVTPHEMLSLLKKNQNNRMWILKQLSQLGIDSDLLQDYSLNELYKHCDQIIRSTYSIKYLGMNQNQMGIISRRIDPFKDNSFNLKEIQQAGYTVNKFFFPKPLKVGKKPKKETDINVDNLEMEIKKAFIKNNPNYSNGNKMQHKVTVNGSWINIGARKQNEHPKHLASEDCKIELTDQFSKKPINSYSRFLSSGLVFKSLDTAVDSS